MAAQDEREPGVVGSSSSVLDPVAQDIPEQEMLVVEEELPPQMDPEPEMGAEAVAYDTSPPPLRQNPPIRLEQSAVDVILQAINGMNERMEANTKGMNETREEIKNNTNKMEEIKNNMEANTQTMRGEMQNMGAGLQDGLEKLKIGNGERRRATGDV